MFDFSLFLIQVKRLEPNSVVQASIKPICARGSKLDESKSSFDKEKVERRNLVLRLVKTAERQHKVTKHLFDILDIEAPNTTMIDFNGDFPVCETNI